MSRASGFLRAVRRAGVLTDKKEMRGLKEACAAAPMLVALVGGCSMPEEVKRIEQVKRAESRQQQSASTYLTGEQVFIRSCNPCHPAGKKGTGPALDKLAEHFPDDEALKSLIRKGKGVMPAQPVDALADSELDSLVAYLRSLGESH